MSEKSVLTEDQAVELFTFLIAAARTQLDDPHHYASMRLLTAAEMLRDFISAGVSVDLQALLQATMVKGERAHIVMNDFDAFVSALDELCTLVAQYLVDQHGLEEARFVNKHTLDVIKSRRVIRHMTAQPLEHEHLEKILEAGRWAPVGGNQRVHRFVAIDDPTLLRLLRMVSPGMFQKPQAIILICIDWDAAKLENFAKNDKTPFIDLGSIMQTMMLAAHSIGVGSGPVTSFAREAVRTILHIPANLEPYLMVTLGYPAPKNQLPMRGRKKVTWQSLTDWNRYER